MPGRITNDLIVNALYLTGELGIGEVPDAFMLTSGLDLLNELLSKFASDGIFIPNYTSYNFNMVPGQDTYTVSSVIPADVVGNPITDLAFANYTVVPDSPTPIVYPLKIIDRAQYYDVTRLKNLTTRPGFIMINKQPQVTILTIYPVPDKPYPTSLQVKAYLSRLNTNDSIENMPPFYYGFLKYAMARKFLSLYPSANWPPTSEEEYQDYYAIAKNANETNLVIAPSAILTAKEPFYWPNILVY